MFRMQVEALQGTVWLVACFLAAPRMFQKQQQLKQASAPSLVHQEMAAKLWGA